MMIYLLLTLTVITLLCDVYIYFRFFRKLVSGRVWHILYILQAFLLDVLAPVVLALSAGGGQEAAQPMLWSVWWIVLSFGTKTLFTAVALIGELVNLVFRRKWYGLAKTGALLAGLVAVTMIYGATAGVSTIRVNRVEIVSDKIPPAFDGYRIVLFSDLHIGNIPKNGKLIPTLIDSINGLSPDLIVNGGDLVNMRSSEITPTIYQLLQQLDAPDGVVSVLGNHDLGIYIAEDDGEASLEQLIAIQHQLGWHLLQNENMWIRRGEDSIAIAGVDFPYHGRHNGMRRAPVNSDLRQPDGGISARDFSVLVAHTPNVWDSIPALAAPDLTMSGHVHAMQMKFTLGRLRFSPAKWLYKHWSGLYEQEGRYLYVNDGAGYVLCPMRIGAPAEVTVFDLKHQGSVIF